MEKFFKLAIIVVLLYFGFTYGKPWIEQMLEMEAVGSDGSDTSRCTRQIQRASAELASRVGRLSIPWTAEDWGSGNSFVQGQLNRAESACVCDEPGCDKGRRILQDLTALTRDVTETASSGKVLSSYEARHRRIEEELEEIGSSRDEAY